jgi:hypothetical protein
MSSLKVSLILILVFANAANAGQCKLKINRVACPGRDVEAYKPYNGKKITEETLKKNIVDETACKEEAEKACKIVRKGTLATKTVTATFNGKPIAGEFVNKSDCK